MITIGDGKQMVFLFDDPFDTGEELAYVLENPDIKSISIQSGYRHIETIQPTGFHTHSRMIPGSDFPAIDLELVASNVRVESGPNLQKTLIPAMDMSIQELLDVIAMKLMERG